MNVILEDVAAAGFDPTAWKEELLTLNPWARGLTIDKANSEFAAARQKATLARHAEGKEVWNDWANGMLALKATLKTADQWSEHEQPLLPPHPPPYLSLAFLPPKGENEATRLWLELASAVFSTELLTHRFERDVSFHQSIFPNDAFFESAAFSGNADFTITTFSGYTDFTSTTFSGYADFTSSTFSGYADFTSATFSSYAPFLSATFSGYADFLYAKFEKPVTFARSIFRKAANFDGIDSAAAFSLAEAMFERVPSFIGATFKGKLRLDNVETPDTA